VCGGARERVAGSYPSPISVGRSATVEKLCRPLCIHFCFKNVLQVQTDAEYLTKTHVQALCSEQALDPPDSLECCPATCDAEVCPQCWLPFMQPYSVPRCLIMFQNYHDNVSEFLKRHSRTPTTWSLNYFRSTTSSKYTASKYTTAVRVS